MKLLAPTNWAAARSLRLASVKANQIVRPSGQPATATSTNTIGATNSQAALVRWRVRREGGAAAPAAGNASAASVATVWRSAYQRPPRESRSSFFSRAARLVSAVFRPLSTSCTALKNSALIWLYLVPVGLDGRATALTKDS